MVKGTTLTAPLKSGKEDIATETITTGASSLRQDVVDVNERDAEPRSVL